MTDNTRVPIYVFIIDDLTFNSNLFNYITKINNDIIFKIIY